MTAMRFPRFPALTMAGLAAVLLAGCMSASKLEFDSQNAPDAVVIVGFDDINNRVPPFMRMMWRQIDPETGQPVDEVMYTFIDTSGAAADRLPGGSAVYGFVRVPPGQYAFESVIASSRFYTTVYQAQTWQFAASRLVTVSEGEIVYLGTFVFETGLNGRAVLRDIRQEASQAEKVRAIAPKITGPTTLADLRPFAYDCQKVDWAGGFLRCAP